MISTVNLTYVTSPYLTLHFSGFEIVHQLWVGINVCTKFQLSKKSTNAKTVADKQTDTSEILYVGFIATYISKLGVSLRLLYYYIRLLVEQNTLPSCIIF